MDLLRDRYEVVLKVSEGGSGAVWLAKDKSQLDGPVALKSIRPMVSNPTARAAAIAQFRHEAYLLGSLDHPGIVSIFDSFGEGDTEYLVMEYLPYPSLKQIVQQGGRMSVRQTVEWALELCDVLHYLHTRTPPVLFHDLKPANIGLDKRKRLRLIDFGISRVLLEGDKSGQMAPVGLTMGFAPPEQYGTTLQDDPRSDVYALGATLYALLTGRVPPESLRLATGTPLRPVSAYVRGIPAALEHAIARMMKPRPKDRPASMAEVRRELESIRDLGEKPPAELSFVECGQCATNNARRAWACRICGTPTDAVPLSRVAGARAAGRGYEMLRSLRRNRFGTLSLATASSFVHPVVLLELDSVEGQDLFQAATQEYRDEEGFRIAAWLDEGWLGTVVVEIPPMELDEEKLLPERLEVFCHMAIDRTMFGG